jgi:hypothetical protein
MDRFQDGNGRLTDRRPCAWGSTRRHRLPPAQRCTQACMHAWILISDGGHHHHHHHHRLPPTPRGRTQLWVGILREAWKDGGRYRVCPHHLPHPVRDGHLHISEAMPRVGRGPVVRAPREDQLVSLHSTPCDQHQLWQYKKSIDYSHRSHIAYTLGRRRAVPSPRCGRGCLCKRSRSNP